MKSIEQDLYDMVYKSLNEEGVKIYSTRPRTPVNFPFAVIGSTGLTFTKVKGPDVVGQIKMAIEIYGDGDDRGSVSLLGQLVYNKNIRKSLIGSDYVYTANLSQSSSDMTQLDFEEKSIWSNTINLLFDFSKKN